MNTTVLLILALACAGAAARAPGARRAALHYHEREGVPAARRILAAERARVAGGQPAAPGAHPYLVGLLVALTIGETSVCGASMLSNTKLVTAAHCWFDGRYQGYELEAVFGSVTLFSGGVRVRSRAVDSHAAYDPSNLNNDIAVVTVPFVAYSNTVRAIALPSGFLSWLTFEWNWATVSGYGVTTDAENITAGQSVRAASVMVVNNLDCATVYGWNVVDSTICTSGQGRVGPCGGDSGGPLALTLSGETYLIGVVSFHAFDGCDIGFPGGYARVTSFLPWLQARL